MFTLFALALFGGESIRHFVIILLVGVFSGTYSSIFNASPILVVGKTKSGRPGSSAVKRARPPRKRLNGKSK